jgi:hypothetical protein
MCTLAYLLLSPAAWQVRASNRSEHLEQTRLLQAELGLFRCFHSSKLRSLRPFEWRSMRKLRFQSPFRIISDQPRTREPRIVWIVRDCDYCRQDTFEDAQSIEQEQENRTNRRRNQIHNYSTFGRVSQDLNPKTWNAPTERYNTVIGRDFALASKHDKSCMKAHGNMEVDRAASSNRSVAQDLDFLSRVLMRTLLQIMQRATQGSEQPFEQLAISTDRSTHATDDGIGW